MRLRTKKKIFFYCTYVILEVRLKAVYMCIESGGMERKVSLVFGNSWSSPDPLMMICITKLNRSRLNNDKGRIGSRATSNAGSIGLLAAGAIVD